MEPRQIGPNGGMEHLSTPTPLFEVSSSRETQLERDVDRQPEAGSARLEAAQVAMPVALPAPVISPIADAGTVSAMSSDDDTPITANDDDLIEKEWVDKAKKILAETRDDPYRREAEVGKLQIEYIRKRYGREIGTVSGE